MSIFDGLPPTIRIGPYDHAVIVEELVDEEGHRLWGQHLHGEFIKLHKNQPNGMFALDTVLHEIVHAIDHCSSIHVGSQEEQMERVASALGTGLTQVLRDNPDLVQWIVKTLGSTSSDTKTCHCLNSLGGDFLTIWGEQTMANTQS